MKKIKYVYCVCYDEKIALVTLDLKSAKKYCYNLNNSSSRFLMCHIKKYYVV